MAAMLLLQSKGRGQTYQTTTDNKSTTTIPLITTSTKTLSSEIGYVFCLQLLSDMKEDSSHFAVAAARYNVVKIIV